MPIYEYRRPDGTKFEIVQSFSDEALKTDPETGVPVERVLHAPAVHFKGKGFYNTDYGTRRRQRETADAAEKSSGDCAVEGLRQGLRQGAPRALPKARRRATRRRKTPNPSPPRADRAAARRHGLSPS